MHRLFRDSTVLAMTGVSELGEWNAVETTKGDSPGCTSSNPSPERIDDAFCGESPLEKSIAVPEK
jgi:hypothetical protein